MVSPQDKLTEGSLGIHQQAYIRLGNFKEGKSITQKITNERGIYIFIIEGEIEVNGEKLQKRDALGVWESDLIEIKSITNSEILLVEVPMN